MAKARHVRHCIALVASTQVIIACTTTTGIGMGHLSDSSTPDEVVPFTWSSTDGGITGKMEARLRGTPFEGRFFQIRQETRAETLIPLWTHWDLDWNDWSFRDSPMPPPQPVPQFITHYSGKVVATLESAQQQRMRCRLQLKKPAIGLSEGAEGECQDQNGKTINVIFPGP